MEDLDGGEEGVVLLGDERGEDLAGAIGGDGEVLGECLVAGATLGIDVEASLDGGTVEGDIHEALAAGRVGMLDEVEPDAVVGAGGEAVEGVVERRVVVAEGLVGAFGERIGDGGAVDSLSEGACVVAGSRLVVAEIGGIGGGGVGGDRALVEDADGVVGVGPRVVDATGVAMDRDPGADREGFGGGGAWVIGTAGHEGVRGTGAEDDLARAGDGLGATVEGDVAGGVAAPVADADGGAVEGEAVADGDRSAGDVEIAGEGDAREGAARRGGDELGGARGLEPRSLERTPLKAQRPRRVDLRHRRRTRERDRGGRARGVDHRRIGRAGEDVSHPVDRVEEVRPPSVAAAIPVDDRHHRPPLEALDPRERSPPPATGDSPPRPQAAAATRKESPKERPGAGETAHGGRPRAGGGDRRNRWQRGHHGTSS